MAYDLGGLMGKNNGMCPNADVTTLLKSFKKYGITKFSNLNHLMPLKNSSGETPILDRTCMKELIL